MKKILIADDHFVVRSGMCAVLKKNYTGCEIDEAVDGKEMVENLDKKTYDLVMMDINMPKTDSLEMMQYIAIKYPATRVLIFSMSPEKIYAKRFLKEGARGFVSKEAPLEELTKAIDLVMNGRVYLSEQFTETLAQEQVPGNQLNKFEKLSKREFEVAAMMLSGQPLNEISKSLNLCPSTIGTHKKRVFEKLEVANILELKELAEFYNVA